MKKIMWAASAAMFVLGYASNASAQSAVRICQDPKTFWERQGCTQAGDYRRTLTALKGDAQ
jgi:hypothetical protein